MINKTNYEKKIHLQNLIFFYSLKKNLLLYYYEDYSEKENHQHSIF